MFQTILLFMFDSPMQIMFVVAIIFLLFGSTKLPQLAKSIGQSKKAFSDGLREAEEDSKIEEERRINAPVLPQINQMSDDELMAEMRRRAQVKQL